MSRDSPDKGTRARQLSPQILAGSPLESVQRAPSHRHRCSRSVRHECTRWVMAVRRAQSLLHADIQCAFFQSEGWYRNLYIFPPRRGNVGPGVWEVHKPIYGLGDAPRAWNLTLRRFLTGYGLQPFHPLLPELCITQAGAGLCLVVFTTVDDLLVGNSVKECSAFVFALRTNFKAGNFTEPDAPAKYDGGIILRDGDAIAYTELLKFSALPNDVKIEEGGCNYMCNREERQEGNFRQVCGEEDWRCHSFECMWLFTKVNWWVRILRVIHRRVDKVHVRISSEKEVRYGDSVTRVSRHVRTTTPTGTVGHVRQCWRVFEGNGSCCQAWNQDMSECTIYPRAKWISGAGY